jgi:inhibin beta
MTEFSASKQIQLDQLGWQKIDVTSIVQSWYQRSGDSDLLQLYIDCSGCGERFQVHLLSPQLPPHKSFTVDPKGQKSHARHDGLKPTASNNDYINDVNRPFLVVHIEPSIMRRSRRRALDCSNAPGSQCCKERFYVSFQRLGWDDWIIAPQGYYANYCRGDCANGLHRTPDTFLTYYSHVFHEVRKYNKLNGNQLCCAPLKFSSMSLIYFGPDSKIIKRDLPKMVVDECGCP